MALEKPATRMGAPRSETKSIWRTLVNKSERQIWRARERCGHKIARRGDKAWKRGTREQGVDLGAERSEERRVGKECH